MNAEEFAWALKFRGVFRYIDNARKYIKSIGKKEFTDEFIETDIEQAWRAANMVCDLDRDINYGRCIELQNVKPCPYCGGEVEVVKLVKKQDEKIEPFRIECKKCHMLTARGRGFECETITEAEERIKDYEKEMKRIWDPLNRTMMLTPDERRALKAKAKRSMLGPDDEANEQHDASHTIFTR